MKTGNLFLLYVDFDKSPVNLETFISCMSIHNFPSM